MMSPHDMDNRVILETISPLLHQKNISSVKAIPEDENESEMYGAMSTNTCKTYLKESGKDEKNEAASEDSCRPTFCNQLWLLTPFFLLHMCASLSGGFTTILVQYLDNPFPGQFAAKNETDDAACHHQHSSILLVTAEDYAPIVVAILGGFLQQWLGPKRILQITSIPFTVSNILVIIAPNNLWLVIASRFMAGLSTGLLSANVYAADMSHREYRQSLKMIEVACRSIGFIMVYVLNLCFFNWDKSPRYIALVSAFLPIISFLGMCFKPESSNFTTKVAIVDSRKRSNVDQEQSVTNEQRNNSDKEEDISKSTIVKFLLKVKILRSPTIYKPLFFISCLIFLKQFSGFSFTKKYLLQILKPPQDNSDPRLPTIFAIGITTIRLFANLFMSKLVRKTRIRFLFFFSLLSTAICLIGLGTLLDDTLISQTSSKVIQYVRVFLLSLHIFLVQFGLQNLSNNMTDILFPTLYKPVMKGLTGAIYSLSNIVIISALTIKIDCDIKYSWTFWIMGSVLLLSSPILYVFVPEVRNIGKDLAGEFYLPSQTIFYFVFETSKTRTNQIFNILKSSNFYRDTFKRAARKIIIARKLSGPSEFCESKVIRSISQTYSHQESVNVFANEAPTVSFDKEFSNLKDLQHSEINKERVAFVHNIHSQTGYLENNKNETRILIGKGPVLLDHTYLLKNGGLFLFNDIIMISQCISANLKYINEVVFKFDDDFKFKVKGNSIIFSNSATEYSVSVNEESTAKVWFTYLTILKSSEKN